MQYAPIEALRVQRVEVRVWVGLREAVAAEVAEVGVATDKKTLNH